MKIIKHPLKCNFEHYYLYINILVAYKDNKIVLNHSYSGIG